MFARIPIIASEIPENMECVNEFNALLFPVGKPDKLFDCMKKAMNIRDWSNKKENAFLHASENFEIERVAELYEVTYDKILEKKI